jgi:hypothetical protein
MVYQILSSGADSRVKSFLFGKEAYNPGRISGRRLTKHKESRRTGIKNMPAAPLVVIGF